MTRRGGRAAYSRAMRLFPGKVSIVATEICDQLSRDKDIETSAPDEVCLDIEAVLKEYLRLDRELTDRAKDQLESRKLSYSQFGRMKKQVWEASDAEIDAILELIQ